MTTEFIIALCIAALIGLIIGFFISRAKNASTLGKQLARIEQQQTQIEQLSQQQQENEVSLTTANEQTYKQTTEIAVLTQQVATLTTDRDSLQQQAKAEQNQAALVQQQLAEANEQLAKVNAQLDSTSEKAQERQQTIQQQKQQLDQQQAKIEDIEQQRNQTNEQLATLKTALDKEKTNAAEKAEDHKQLKQELQQQREKTSEVEIQRNTLSEELATLKTSLKEKEGHFKQQLTQLDEQKVILKKEFQNMANEILDAKSKAFNTQNKQSLDALLNPFKQQINDFKGKVENLHLEGTKQQSEMRTELKQLQSMHQQMTQEAHNLATALQGQKKVQGNWGELVLENVLESSGLHLGKDYKREDSFVNDDGKRGRPDVVVYLPQNKHLIIDAKVSLNAYTRYVNSEDDLERQKAINEHVNAFSDRIKELADRDYYKLNGINSPEMVFMFVPIESAFVEAMKADETLFQKAIEQNVLVATPTTLLTSLNIVRQLWRFEDQNKHTAELAKKAEGVFKKLKTFLNSFQDIKNGLQKAQDSYNTAESQLVSGRGNLVKQVGEFKQLAPAIKDQLPQYFVEKAELELTPKAITAEITADEHQINTQQETH